MTANAITIDDLHSIYRQGGRKHLILDVRSPGEYRQRHISGSPNMPFDQIERRPQEYAVRLRHYEAVSTYCTSGVRARRALDALAKEGLPNLSYVSGGGMTDWVMRGYPSDPGTSLSEDLLTGIVGGLLADVAAGQADKLLGRLVSEDQQRREKRIRQASPHKVGGTLIAERVTGKGLSAAQRRKAQLAFTTAYGIGWGMIYAACRRRFPRASLAAGLPFAIGFFFACDGLLAPLFSLSPPLRRIPWQPGVKELANHVVWTAAAEMVHRAAVRATV